MTYLGAEDQEDTEAGYPYEVVQMVRMGYAITRGLTNKATGHGLQGLWIRACALERFKIESALVRSARRKNSTDIPLSPTGYHVHWINKMPSLKRPTGI